MQAINHPALSQDTPEWQVTVFCQNEQSRISACLKSIAAAVGTHRALITIIINGSTDGSLAAARRASADIATPVQIFNIAHADKSNAINAAIHNRCLRQTAALYFFIDGYVTIAPTALIATAARLAERKDAVAATGIPGNGRTASRARKAAIEVGGVLNGQFYALKADFVERMTAAEIRLPVGLYRGDGLLGSMAAHDLDALGQPWMNGRLIGVPEAIFEIDALSLFCWGDLRRQFRRKTRQMRGKVENAAIGKLIYAGGYVALPHFADDMIRDFLARYPVPSVAWPERPFMALALKHHHATRRPMADTLLPERIQ